MVLMGVAVAVAVWEVGYMFGLLGSGTPVGRWATALLTLSAAPGLACLSGTMRRNARLHTGPVTQTLGDEPYVLFVRPFPGEPLLSFGQPVMPDVVRYTFSWLDFSVEEELDKIFNPYGKLVCLGDPGSAQGLPWRDMPLPAAGELAPRRD